MVENYDRSGDPQEAAMLAACSLERRPYGKAFVEGRVASNWRWNEVKNDPRREVEFSQKRHGDTPFENPLCELFIVKRMLEQGGSASLIYRCELVRDDLARSYGNIQAGNVTSQGAFGILDSVMGSRSSDNKERVCRDPNTDELFACAMEDLGSHLGNNSMQRKAAENLMNLCRSRGANMNTTNSYFSAGLTPSGGFCSSTGGASVNTGVPVVQIQEPWYKTVLNASLGALKIIGPLKVLNDGHKRREQTSQLAINRNYKLGFPSAVSGAGMWGGTGGCSGYGTCGGNGGIVVGGGMGGCGGGFCGGGAIGGGYGMGVGMGTCGTPPYAPWSQGCGGGGYYGGMGTGGYGMGGYGGVASYPGLYGYPGMAAGGMPGPFGTNGGGNGWSPGMYGNPWGMGGQYGQPSYWGTGYGNGMAGGTNGYYVDSYNAQMARSTNRSNRYGQLYDNLGTDSRGNAGNLWNTTSSYSGGYSYYPPYSSVPQCSGGFGC
jgi:hypothetical protein